MTLTSPLLDFEDWNQEVLVLYYIAVTPQSPESPHWPFISKALSEEDKGSMCPGNQVVASPAQTLFTENLPGTQSSALWTMVCVLRYPSHNRFGQFESHDPGPHDRSIFKRTILSFKGRGSENIMPRVVANTFAQVNGIMNFLHFFFYVSNHS